MAKIVENTFAQVNIAFVNELALVCNELGIDVDVCHLNEGHAAFAVLERAVAEFEYEHIAGRRWRIQRR